MPGKDKELHQTRAAGNLGSAALLLRLLPADAAKTIFLGLILQLPAFPSWLSLAHGFVRKLAKSRSLSRKTAGIERGEGKYLTTFVFPRAFLGQQAPICALRSPALGLTLLSQQEEVWREQGGEKWKDMVYFKGNLTKTEKTQNSAARAIMKLIHVFFPRNSQLQP